LALLNPRAMIDLEMIGKYRFCLDRSTQIELENDSVRDTRSVFSTVSANYQRPRITT